MKKQESTRRPLRIQRATPPPPSHIPEDPISSKNLDKNPPPIPLYDRPPSTASPDDPAWAAFDEACRIAAVSIESLSSAPFPRFWSAVLRSEPPFVIQFVDSFIAKSPRPWSPIRPRRNDGAVRDAAARLFSRLATRPRTAPEVIGPDRFAKELVADRAVFTAPKVVSACAVFAGSEAVAAAVASLMDTSEDCGRALCEELSSRAAPAICKALAVDVAAAARTEDGAVRQCEFVLDAAATLSSFLRTCPWCSTAFLRAGALESISRCYAAVPRLIELGAPDDSAIHASRCLLACAATIVGSALFAPLSSDSKSSDTSKLTAAEGTTQFLSFALDNGGELFTDLARKCSLASRLSSALSSNPTLL